MSDSLNLAMRISAIDLFSGVLRRFRSEIMQSGASAKAMQRDYDSVINNTGAGLKSFAFSKFAYDKLKPAVAQAADLQESLLAVEGILQGAHPDAGKLADQMQRVRENSIEVAKHMKFSATAVTDVTRELLQGGVPLDAILGGKKGSAYAVEALAEVSKQDPSTTAANIANVAHSFQLTPDQYASAVDTIARGSITSSGGLTQLFHNLEQVGSRAHMFGDMDLKSTVIALKALSPLGEEGGSDLGQALAVMTGGAIRGQKRQKAWGLNFYKDGKFIGLDASLQELREKMATMTEQQRNEMLGQVFQTTGGKAITQLLAPSLPGVKSYDEIKKSIDEQASLEQRMTTWEKGLNASLQELTTTNQSTLAALFDPMLGKLTDAVKLANQLSGSVGSVASQHRAVADAASVTGAIAVGSTAAYGIYRLGKAMGPGSRLLKGFLSGTANVATGVAEGKAIEAMTGVTPVFVTNFPGNLGGVGSSAPKAAEEAAASGVGATIKRYSVGAVAALGAYTAAAVGGIYAMYKTADDLPQATQAAEEDHYADVWKKGGIYHSLQPRSETRHLSEAEVAMRKSMEQAQPYGQWYDQHKGAYHWWENDRPIDDWKSFIAQQSNAKLGISGQAQPKADVEGTIHIQLSQDGRAKVTQAKSSNPNLDFQVGQMMVMP